MLHHATENCDDGECSEAAFLMLYPLSYGERPAGGIRTRDRQIIDETASCAAIAKD